VFSLFLFFAKRSDFEPRGHIELYFRSQWNRSTVAHQRYYRRSCISYKVFFISEWMVRSVRHRVSLVATVPL
jgi:hypothetical protein